MIIPWLGDVTIVTAFIAIIAFAIGYVVVAGLKHSIKIVFIILIIVAGLYVIGLIPTDAISKLTTLYDIFKPFMTSITGMSSFVSNTLSLPLIALAAGAIYAWFKG